MDEEEENTSTVDETMGREMSGGRRRRKQTRKSGKSRKSNNALKEWVRFVKKVRAEEKIDSYKKAMSRAKVRADKGEKWRSMKGGEEMDEEMNKGEMGDEELKAMKEQNGGIFIGGRRRRSRSRGRSRHRTMRRSRRRSSRRH